MWAWKLCDTREVPLLYRWIKQIKGNQRSIYYKQALKHESNSHLRWQTGRQTGWQCYSQAKQRAMWQKDYLWTAWMSGDLVVLQADFLTDLILPLYMLGVQPRIIPQIIGSENKNLFYICKVWSSIIYNDKWQIPPEKYICVKYQVWSF